MAEAVILSAVEGSRCLTLKLTSTGSLAVPRDDH